METELLHGLVYVCNSRKPLNVVNSLFAACFAHLRKPPYDIEEREGELAASHLHVGVMAQGHAFGADTAPPPDDHLRDEHW